MSLLGSASALRRLVRRGRLSPRHAFRLKILLSIAVACLLEVALHVYSHAIPRPARDLDGPFSTQCQDPTLAAAAHPRENATFVMLARNDDLQQALQSVEQIERQFNQWFRYPILFLNNEEWDPEFVRIMKAKVSGEASFEVLSQKEWSFPAGTDVEHARSKIDLQGKQGIYKGGMESYHHMCRFYSG
jgi:mannosyltransferase